MSRTTSTGAQTFQAGRQARRLSALEAAEMPKLPPLPTRTMAWTDCSSTRRPRATCRPTGSNGCRAVPNPPYGLDGQALRPSLRPPWLRLELHLDRPPCSAQAWCQAPRHGAHRRAPRKPCRHDAPPSRHEWLAGQAACDLMHHGRRHQPAFLVEEEGTASTFRALKQVFCDKGMPSSLYTDRGSHYFHTPEAGGKVAKDRHTQVGRALHQLGIEHIAAYSPEARGRSERAFGTLQDRLVKELALAGIATVEAADRFIADTYLPEPLHHPARTRSCPSNTPARSRHPLSPHRPHGRPRQHRALRKARPPDPRYPSQTPLRQGQGPGPRVSRRNPRPLPRAPMPRPLHRQRRAHRNPNPAGRVRRFDATGRRPVDKWTAAPRLTTSPQDKPQQQKRTNDVLPKPDKSTC